MSNLLPDEVTKAFLDVTCPLDLNGVASSFPITDPDTGLQALFKLRNRTTYQFISASQYDGHTTTVVLRAFGSGPSNIIDQSFIIQGDNVQKRANHLCEQLKARHGSECEITSRYGN